MQFYWLGNVLIDSFVKTFKIFLLSEYMSRIQEIMGLYLKFQKSNCKLPSLAFGPSALKSTMTYLSKVVKLIASWCLKNRKRNTLTLRKPFLILIFIDKLVIAYFNRIHIDNNVRNTEMYILYKDFTLLAKCNKFDSTYTIEPQ